MKQFIASYNVNFYMSSKTYVNVDDAHPRWKWRKVQAEGWGILGNSIKRNFTEFPIDKDDGVVKQFRPLEEPWITEKGPPATCSSTVRTTTTLVQLIAWTPRSHPPAPTTVCLEPSPLLGQTGDPCAPLRGKSPGPVWFSACHLPLAALWE